MNPLLISLMMASATWTPSTSGNQCQYFVGERIGDYAPVRAECQWDIKSEVFHQLLADFADHDLYFETVDQCDALDKSQGLFQQVHVSPGISEREVVIKMWQEKVDGGIRYHWTKHSDQSANSGKRVEVKADTGFWQVTDMGGGKTQVIYQLHYDPGGSIPSFIVRWFTTTGLETFVGELHAYAKKTAAAN